MFRTPGELISLTRFLCASPLYGEDRARFRAEDRSERTYSPLSGEGARPPYRERRAPPAGESRGYRAEAAGSPRASECALRVRERCSRGAGLRLATRLRPRAPRKRREDRAPLRAR